MKISLIISRKNKNFRSNKKISNNNVGALIDAKINFF